MPTAPADDTAAVVLRVGCDAEGHITSYTTPDGTRIHTGRRCDNRNPLRPWTCRECVDLTRMLAGESGADTIDLYGHTVPTRWFGAIPVQMPTRTTGPADGPDRIHWTTRPWHDSVHLTMSGTATLDGTGHTFGSDDPICVDNLGDNDGIDAHDPRCTRCHDLNRLIRADSWRPSPIRELRFDPASVRTPRHGSRPDPWDDGRILALDATTVDGHWAVGHVRSASPDDTVTVIPPATPTLCGDSQPADSCPTCADKMNNLAHGLEDAWGPHAGPHGWRDTGPALPAVRGNCAVRLNGTVLPIELLLVGRHARVFATPNVTITPGGPDHGTAVPHAGSPRTSTHYCWTGFPGTDATGGTWTATRPAIKTMCGRTAPTPGKGRNGCLACCRAAIEAPRDVALDGHRVERRLRTEQPDVAIHLLSAAVTATS